MNKGLTACIAAMLAAGTAPAHHSYTMFDLRQPEGKPITPPFPFAKAPIRPEIMPPPFPPH